MILRTSGQDVAEQAITGGYIGTSYNKLDCQAFVEQVLKDLGVRKKDGSPYNWKGSNSMWRTHITWRGTIKECKDKFGDIPLGAFLFLLKYDGGEREKGYNDELGNASHVGLYVGTAPLPVIDSSKGRGTVDYTKLSVFTHVGLMDMIDYYNEAIPPATDREKALEALEILTKYVKGV